MSELGINYLSQWHWYNKDYTTNEVLHRDFTRFKNDGITYISLSLYWFRLEGNIRGDYTGSEWYGDQFLDDVKRVIDIAHQHGIKTMITIHTVWDEKGTWCTPNYVIDPVTGENIELAVVRSTDMWQAFIDMFTHTVDHLKGTAGIWCWALNEPWYWPYTLEPPFEEINQKENFIALFQEMSHIVKTLDGRPFTVRFVNHQYWIVEGTYGIKNIFTEDWNWDDRIFDALNFISFNNYIPDPTIREYWKLFTNENITGCKERGKTVWITEFGGYGDDPSQIEIYTETLDFLKTLLFRGIFPWFWRGDTSTEDPDPPNTGYNICASAETGEGRPSYYVFITTTPISPFITLESMVVGITIGLIALPLTKNPVISGLVALGGMLTDIAIRRAAEKNPGDAFDFMY